MLMSRVAELPLDVEFGGVYEIAPNKAVVVGYTHRFFNKYPARYIPQIPRWAISKYLPGDEDGLLDPFCGSGTTLVEGVLSGKTGFAIDVDPFARLLTRVKTRPFSLHELETLDRIVAAIRKRLDEPIEVSIPVPPIPNLRKWFREDVTESLLRLKQLIYEETGGEGPHFDYLNVVLASIIRKVSNAEDGSPKPYISTRYPKEPKDPRTYFFQVHDLYRTALAEFSMAVLAQPTFWRPVCKAAEVLIVGDDARAFDLPSRVRLAVTSPPYINAFDYVRSLKFENMWLGLADPDDLIELRRRHVGTESLGIEQRRAVLSEPFGIPELDDIVDRLRAVDPARAAIVAAFFRDMEQNLACVHRSLESNGVYVIVVGNSKIRGIVVPTLDILVKIANELGFHLETQFSYVIRDRYLHIPRGGQGGLIEFDHVAVLRKRD